MVLYGPSYFFFFLSFIRDLKERGGQRLSTLSIKKGTALTTTKVPIKDGQLLFETDTQKIWLDNGTVRLQMGGADTIAWNNITSKPSYYDAKAIKSITRSGTTFTYTCLDGTTGTFTQQDNNTTYSNATTSASGLMTAAMVTKLNGIATGANAYTLPAATSSVLGGVKVGSNITVSSGTISLTKANVIAALGYTPPTSDTNTTYSAGTGISLSGTTFSNSGVRSIATGSSNGTISVNTNGTSADVAVKGLGSNAYTSTAYLPLAGGTITGILNMSYTASRIEMQNKTNSAYYTVLWNHNNGNLTFDALGGVLYLGYYATTQILFQSGNWGRVDSSGIYGAVWNDYAEFRSTVPNAKPGQVVIENGDGTLHLSTERLQPGCEVVSDTFGFAIGETDECKTPIAAAGRVLVYTYEDRDTFIAGEPVCSGPNGTVSRMTREETKEYPERIIGTVSEIPSYTHWGTGNVEVDGRIWIKVK